MMSRLKFTRDGQSMYPLGNQEPIACCCLVANSGENTKSPLHSISNDLQFVSTTFKRVGAEIMFEQRYKGMELQDVENLLTKLKTTSLKKCPCFVFYYTGHGKDCGIQLDADSTFPFLDIIGTITSLPDLAGKPKVFIFDCCRVVDEEPERRNNCKIQSYKDCVIAYACSTGEKAFISNSPHKENNSIFTKAFCSMLLENHCRWPLVSILIHASSMTSETMEGYRLSQTRITAENADMIEPVSSQTPHVVVKLGKQLFLCLDSYVERTDSDNINMDCEPSIDKKHYRDGVPTKKMQFNSKEDVMNNLGSLGQWLKIFICYAPSVNSKDSKGKLESRIYTFARHLITYGFDVTVDLFVNFTVGFDWASWTEHEMSQADWIIFVNSQSSYELLCHPSGPKEVEISAPSVSKANPFDTAVNEATKKIKFSGRLLYNRLYHDTTLKIIPVVLLQEDNKQEYILPILRDVNSVLCVYEDVPFDYAKLEGHFERLVCRMAGINRLAIGAAGVENKFIKLASKISQREKTHSHNQQAEQEVTSQAPVNSPYRHVSSAGGSVPEPHSYQTLSSHYYPNAHSQETMPSSLSTIPQHSYNPPTMTYQPAQSQYVQTQHPQYPEQSGSRAHFSCNSEISQPFLVHNNASQHLIPPANSPVLNNTANHVISPVSSPVPSKTTTRDLPSYKIPIDSPILWQLSQEVSEWKFLGRFLDLDEDIIEEIDQYTRPNKTRDKSLKVLTEWVNSSSEATWKTLGEALQDAGNTLLYEKLTELIKNHAI